ncbi:hypothetical protein SFR_2574 [Streptomyces sp. FR-008]|nr:hypothetical protein SFR_2574 [Streptomyces sp. FR-008]
MPDTSNGPGVSSVRRAAGGRVRHGPSRPARAGSPRRVPYGRKASGVHAEPGTVGSLFAHNSHRPHPGVARERLLCAEKTSTVAARARTISGQCRRPMTQPGAERG